LPVAVDRDFTIDDGMDPVSEGARIIYNRWRYNRWRFIIGFSFPFLDNVKSKFEKEE